MTTSPIAEALEQLQLERTNLLARIEKVDAAIVTLRDLFHLPAERPMVKASAAANGNGHGALSTEAIRAALANGPMSPGDLAAALDVGPQKGDERMLHAFTRMQKLGRNFGIGSSYISQRPQEVNKKALNMAQTLFVFRTTGTHERTAIEKWIEDKSLDETIANDLPKIPTGDCHVWSPEFLKISETVHILEKVTFNASATPEVGVVAKARELAPIDLEQVRSDMAATIEKAKADDPRELRKEIAALRKGLAEKVSLPAAKQTPVVERFVLKDEQLGRAEKLAAQIDGVITRYVVRVEKAIATLDSKLELDKPLSALRVIQENIAAAIAQTRAAEPSRVHPTQRQAAPPRPSLPAPSVRAVSPAAGNGTELTPAKRKILNGLAFLRGIGVTPADKTQLFNNLGALRSAGFILYPSSGDVDLTDAGAALASTDGIPTTVDELHAAIRGRVPPAKWKILDALIQAYPDQMSKDELARRIDVQPTSGAYFNNLGSLRSLGLIDYPQPGQVAAQSVLFLEAR